MENSVQETFYKEITTGNFESGKYYKELSWTHSKWNLQHGTTYMELSKWNLQQNSPCGANYMELALKNYL